jgi:hypothetical protein
LYRRGLGGRMDRILFVFFVFLLFLPSSGRVDRWRLRRQRRSARGHMHDDSFGPFRKVARPRFSA